MGEDKPFTVRDRRLFTSDGERRNEEPEPAPDDAAEPAPPPEPSTAMPPADQPGVDFASFIASLASQASMLLTGEEDDLTARLMDARHLISILEMLEDKTEGRRTPQEETLLKQILYELRMGYVARSRAVGA